MSTRKIVSANSRCYKDGFAVHSINELPGVGTELIGAELLQGVPYFNFGATHHKVSTLTEEDFAVCARLAQDEKRPGFFYRSFLPGHPFYPTGRLYQLYDPPYLRGTSVGKTLADADWIMKCQHVGVRSNEEKTQFWLWNDVSGLATRVDFRENVPGATIMMECKSVKLNANSEQEITFDVDQPKMQIRSVFGDKVNSAYSNYMTDNYDSVAYDHAPVYFKVKEIIKLMLCLEWMKKKGIQFSKEWMMEKAFKPNPSLLPRAIALKTTQIPPQIVEDLTNQLMRENSFAKKATCKLLPDWSPAETKVEKRSFGNCFLLKLTTMIGDFEFTREIRVTQNDFNFLCEGIDPNIPVDFFEGNAVIPDVRSFPELYAETVPQPSKWLVTQNGYKSMPIVGGVSTNNIPDPIHVPSAVPQKPREIVKIPASKAKAPVKIKKAEQPSIPVVRPPQHYPVDSAERRRNEAIARSGVATAVGYSAGCGTEMFTGEGKPVKKVEPVYIRDESKITDKRQTGCTITQRFGVYNGTKEQPSTRPGTINPRVIMRPQPNEKGSPTESLDSGIGSVDEPPSMAVGSQPTKPNERKIKGSKASPVPKNLPLQERAQPLVNRIVSPTGSEDSGIEIVDQPPSMAVGSQPNKKARKVNDNPVSPHRHLPLQCAQPQGNEKGSPTGSEDSGLGSMDGHRARPLKKKINSQPTKPNERKPKGSQVSPVAKNLPLQERAQPLVNRKGSPTGSEDSGIGSVDQPPSMAVGSQPTNPIGRKIKGSQVSPAPNNLPLRERAQQLVSRKGSPTGSEDSGIGSIDQDMAKPFNKKLDSQPTNRKRKLNGNPVPIPNSLPLNESYATQSQASSKASSTGNVEQRMSEPPGMEVDQPVKSEKHSMSDSGILSANSDLQSLASGLSGESSGEDTVVEGD